MQTEQISTKTKYVYIVLSRSNTWFAKIVRIFTHAYYNHTSITFDLSLNTLYSFGRLNPTKPLPGGFVIEGKNKGFYKYYPLTEICVLKLPVSNEEYETIHSKLELFINNPKNFKYNLLKIPCVYLKIPFKDTKRYTCSSFVAYLLEDVLNFKQSYSFTKPEDFLKFNLEKIIECKISKY